MSKALLGLKSCIISSFIHQPKKMKYSQSIEYIPPNSDWDYFTRWKQLHIIQLQVESLREYLSHVESATLTSDSIVDKRLAEISKNLSDSYNFAPTKP